MIGMLLVLLRKSKLLMKYYLNFFLLYSIQEYREAISKGHGGYLMDEDQSDLFTVSVGNLPPKTDVVIKIL